MTLKLIKNLITSQILIQLKHASQPTIIANQFRRITPIQHPKRGRSYRRVKRYRTSIWHTTTISPTLWVMRKRNISSKSQDWPSICRWSVVPWYVVFHYRVLAQCGTLNLKIFFQNKLIKILSLLEITERGIPCKRTISLIKVLAIDDVVKGCLRGKKWVDLVTSRLRNPSINPPKYDPAKLMVATS